LPEKKESLLRSEIARSREDPFDQGLEQGDGLLGMGGGSAEGEENPLKDLKAEVLSIDWEITDKVMTRFINEVERLRETYRNDKVLLVFLRLLDSIGNYVKINKGKAHPNAIKLLNSVYNSLEKVLQLKGTTEEEREKILSIEIERFKRLKAQIAQRKAAAVSRKAVRPTVQTKQRRDEEVLEDKGKAMPDVAPKLDLQSHDEGSQALVGALKEMKEFIRSEFEALRRELRSLKEEAQCVRTEASK